MLHYLNLTAKGYTMKTLTLLLLPALFISFSVASETTGEELFKTKCVACHITTPPTDRSKLIAPPAMGITRHVKMHYPNREDAVKFMVEYIKNPSKEKAVCIPISIQRFGLMPSQKGLATDEEFTKIANYLYDNFGNRGQGYGRGRGQGQGFGQGQGCQGPNCGNGQGRGQGRGNGQGQGMN